MGFIMAGFSGVAVGYLHVEIEWNSPVKYILVGEARW